MWNMIKNNLWGKLQDVYIILLVLVAVFTYQFYSANKVKVDNTGYTYDTGKRVKVLTKDANDSWAFYTKSYKYKTGSALTSENVSKHIDRDEAVENALEFNPFEITKNPDILTYSNYAIDGYIVSKVRTGKNGQDYIVLATKAGNVRVYYFGQLPSQNREVKVTIYGILLGKPVDNGDKYVSMVSNKENTVTFK